MRAGIFLAYWPWFSPTEQVELAVLADELGLDSVWIAEAWGQDAVSVLGLLAGKTVVHEGREYRVPLDGAKPLKLLAKPVQERIPVYLGAVGPKAVEQVGEIADGWLPFLVDPAQFGVLMEPLQRGLEKAGRDVGEIDIAAAVPVGLSEDIGAARDAVRPWLAFYV